MSKEGIKRLFFAVEVHAPWPPSLPEGRILDEEHRHMTLDFLGSVPYEPLLKLIEEFPPYPFSFGSVGYFDESLFLPPKHPNVVAWHAKWFDELDSLSSFQALLTQWLSSHGYSLETRPWMPHLTICRKP